MALFRQQFKAERVSLLVWSVILAVLNFQEIYLWESLMESGSMAQMQEMIQQMPEAMRAMYGAAFDLTTLTGYLQAFAFGGWLFIPFIIYVSLFVTGIVTREMDRRTMEFLLSLPVTRWQILLTRWGGLVAALAVIHLFQFAAVTGAVAAMGHEPPILVFLVAALNSLLVLLAVGSILLALSILVDDYGRGIGLTLGVGLGFYFFHIATEKTEGALKAVRDLLPFSFFDTAAIIGRGEVPWEEMAILVLISLAGLGLAIFLFQRKQISV